MRRERGKETMRRGEKEKKLDEMKRGGLKKTKNERENMG